MGQHKSTRNRCNTCKVRKVKCDEARPACLQCLRQAHVCTYGSSGFSYQSSVETIIDFNTRSTVTTEAAVADEAETVFFPMCVRPVTPLCSPFIRFTMRTGPSLFTPSAEPMYPRILLQLSRDRPYLRHALLTVTITHDWTIYESECPKAVSIQAYHMSACARTLHDRLSRLLNEIDRDALWASAALLMCASIAGTVQTKQSLNDLDWIHVCRRTANLALAWKELRGVRLLMCWLKPQKCSPNVRLAGPAAIETQVFDKAIETVLGDALEGSDQSTARTLSASLQALMRIECKSDTIFNFLAWFGAWPDLLLQRIRDRNVNAMLILAIWCAKTCGFRWWLSRRSTAVLRETYEHFKKFDVPNNSCAILLQYCKIAYDSSQSRLALLS